MKINRYVKVNRSGDEGDWEYEDIVEAIEACSKDEAVLERTYEYADSVLVWTPDGSNVWPPKSSADDKEGTSESSP